MTSVHGERALTAYASRSPRLTQRFRIVSPACRLARSASCFLPLSPSLRLIILNHNQARSSRRSDRLRFIAGINVRRVPRSGHVGAARISSARTSNGSRNRSRLSSARSIRAKYSHVVNKYLSSLFSSYISQLFSSPSVNALHRTIPNRVRGDQSKVARREPRMADVFLVHRHD